MEGKKEKEVSVLLLFWDQSHGQYPTEMKMFQTGGARLRTRVLGKCFDIAISLMHANMYQNWLQNQKHWAVLSKISDVYSDLDLISTKLKLMQILVGCVEMPSRNNGTDSLINHISVAP